MNAWEWPQWVYAIVMAFNFLATCLLHGRPRTGTFDAAGSAIGGALTIWVLAAGGFF